MDIKRIVTALLSIMICVSLQAQLNRSMGGRKTTTAATCVTRIEMTGTDKGKLIITITPTKGWHVYGFDIAKGGPKAMTLNLDKSTGVKFTSDVKYSVKPVQEYDDTFGMEVSYWDTKVELTREFVVTGNPDAAKLIGTITYQGCNGTTCNMPETKSISLKVPTK